MRIEGRIVETMAIEGKGCFARIEYPDAGRYPHTKDTMVFDNRVLGFEVGQRVTITIEAATVAEAGA